MKPIEELCKEAEKVPDTTRSYKCNSDKPCNLRTNLFGEHYCIYPLDPKKYEKDLPPHQPEEHYLKYFPYGNGAGI